jgi:alkylation response protein AidB-like acyl-CoA dehydrogenase
VDIRFIPTDEQVMFRDSVRRWLERGGEAGDDPWSHFAEMGWLMAALPEEVGGLGGSLDDAAIIAEELGRGLVRAPFVEVAVTTAQLLLKLAPERVAAVASGDSRPILAHDEADARGDPLWVSTRARRDDEGWRLTGRKTGIVGAEQADVILVSAVAEGQGLTLFELPADAAPLRRFRTIDDRSGAELRLSDTRAVPVGPLGGAEPALLHALDCALVLESAEALGGMARVLDMTRDYLMTRKQFGRPIGDFQALRHRLADMFIEVEQARSMVLRGLAGLREASPRERARLAAATRARVAQAGAFVGAQGIQLHGGIGVTEEYPVGHYFRRLTAFDLRHGPSAVHVERFARLSLPAQAG